MGADRVLVYDTTLRDGLRNSGIGLSLDGKLALADRLSALGVDAVEVGFGGPSQVEFMRRISAAVDGPIVYGLTRVNRRDVDRVLAGTEPARRRGVNVFHPVSDAFLDAGGVSRQQALDRTAAAIDHARAHSDAVMFATQDATRADPDFLVEMCRVAVEAGAGAVSIADTVSHAVPAEFGALCALVRERTPGAGAVVWSVHCHNGLGLAVANCLAAVDAGARMVECTIDGVGEGAGNAPLEVIVEALASRPDVHPAAADGIDRARLATTRDLLRRLAQPAAPG